MRSEIKVPNHAGIDGSECELITAPPLKFFASRIAIDYPRAGAFDAIGQALDSASRYVVVRYFAQVFISRLVIPPSG